MSETERELFKALELASRRLDIAASRMDRADTEFGFRVWAEEARAALSKLSQQQGSDATGSPQAPVAQDSEAISNG